MKNELVVLIITAVSLGFLHTLFSSDHYVPFVVMAKARKWSLVKTGWITLLCGLGHILSSVLIGLTGIVLELTVSKLKVIESFRGGLCTISNGYFGQRYYHHNVIYSHNLFLGYKFVTSQKSGAFYSCPGRQRRIAMWYDNYFFRLIANPYFSAVMENSLIKSVPSRLE